MRWLFSIALLYLLQIPAKAQAQQVTANAQLCGGAYLVTGDVSGTNYTIKVTLGANTVRTIELKKNKKDTRETFKQKLSDALHQSNLFGPCQPPAYGLIYAFADKFTEKAIQTWFPETGMAEDFTVNIDENDGFTLTHGKADRKYQLIFSQKFGDNIPLVNYDEQNHRYVIDWDKITASDEIRKNFDKFLNCYNRLLSSVKPKLYLLQISETEYKMVESYDDEAGAAKSTILKKTIASLVGEPKQLTIGGAYQTVYSINYTPMPAPASKKGNNDSKFKEHN